ncbi:MAG TPA: response regulator [Opitutaceae bacterium]|jgi:two-component system chemotaxis response regulator CheY
MSFKVLIIDDSALARRTVRSSLESIGCQVEEAPDGNRGLEIFFLSPPQLVILDMVMEGMYGLEVLMKMLQLNPEVRVIVATADIQRTTAEEAKAAGAKGIINKPMNRRKLVEAVNTVMAGGEVWN